MPIPFAVLLHDWYAMSSKGSRFLIRLISVLWILAGVAGLMPALFSVMLFDAPGSESNPATIALALAVATFPFVCLGAAVQSLRSASADSGGDYRLLFLPLLNIVVAAIAVAWIEAFQNGRFNG